MYEIVTNFPQFLKWCQFGLSIQFFSESFHLSKINLLGNNNRHAYNI